MDVGCGGHLVRELGNAAGNEGRVVGIDSSPQMLENARAVCQGLPVLKLLKVTQPEYRLTMPNLMG